MLAEQILSSGNALLAKHIKVNGLSPKSLCPTLSQHKNTALRGTYGSYQEPKSWQHSTWVIFQKHPKAISLSTNKNSLTKYVFFFDQMISNGSSKLRASSLAISPHLVAKYSLGSSVSSAAHNACTAIFKSSELVICHRWAPPGKSFHHGPIKMTEVHDLYMAVP